MNVARFEAAGQIGFYNLKGIGRLYAVYVPQVKCLERAVIPACMEPVSITAEQVIKNPFRDREIPLHTLTY